MGSGRLDRKNACLHQKREEVTVPLIWSALRDGLLGGPKITVNGPTEPRSSHNPVSSYGDLRAAEDACRFLLCQFAPKTEVNDLSLSGSQDVVVP